jgi:hypothetical protein
MKIFIFFFITILSNHVNANFEKKIVIYSCPTSATAYTCSSKCEKTNMEFQIKVNSKQKQVMIIKFEDGKQEGSIVINDDNTRKCNFFDSKNWKCSDILSSYSMTNGIFVSEFKQHNSLCGK